MKLAFFIIWEARMIFYEKHDGLTEISIINIKIGYTKNDCEG